MKEKNDREISYGKLRRSNRGGLNPNWWWKIFRLNGGRIGIVALCLFLIYVLVWLNSSGCIEEITIDQHPHSNPCTTARNDQSDPASRRCITMLPTETPILTAECPSRLGNQMFSYAILYAISLYNHRTAYMSPLMSNFISKYFKNSLDTLDEDVYKSTQWSVQYLGGNVPATIKNLSTATPYIKFCCYPQAWKYFDEIRPRILHEFRFQDHVEKIVQNEFAIARKQYPKSSGPFVGVHIRRTDYLGEEKRTNFHLASTKFYKGAMDYFKSKFIDPIFIIASDDIPWCRQNFGSFEISDGFSIHYINGTSHEDGGLDLAVLAKCDHVIFGMGTFGFWAAYLSPGEVIYCSDCLTKDSVWVTDPLVYGGDYGNFVLPSWKGMSRNGTLSS